MVKQSIIEAFKSNGVSVRVRVFKHVGGAMYRACVLGERPHDADVVGAVAAKVGAYAFTINQDYEACIRVAA